jgi:hypothetical protein
VEPALVSAFQAPLAQHHRVRRSAGLGRGYPAGGMESWATCAATFRRCAISERLMTTLRALAEAAGDAVGQRAAEGPDALAAVGALIPEQPNANRKPSSPRSPSNLRSAGCKMALRDVQ